MKLLWNILGKNQPQGQQKSFVQPDNVLRMYCEFGPTRSQLRILQIDIVMLILSVAQMSLKIRIKT